MSQAAKAQEPSMEEILASIRRIIADDDGTKPAAKAESKAEPKPEPPAAKAPPPPPPPPKPAPAPSAAMGQDDIDAMLAGLDEPSEPEPPPPPPPPPPPEPEPEPDVLELTPAMQAPAAPVFRKIEAQQDVVFDETPDPPPRPRAPDPPRAPPPSPAMSEPSIMSSATASAVDSAFNALAHTVLVQNAKTLEDLVKEMLRPMLQHWLDNNLPTLVERLVRQEIERVARGRN
jgi:cell pole-organizing protein PopZ